MAQLVAGVVFFSAGILCALVAVVLTWANAQSATVRRDIGWKPVALFAGLDALAWWLAVSLLWGGA